MNTQNEKIIRTRIKYLIDEIPHNSLKPHDSLEFVETLLITVVTEGRGPHAFNKPEDPSIKIARIKRLVDDVPARMLVVLRKGIENLNEIYKETKKRSQKN